jgi:hypothetical protein
MKKILFALMLVVFFQCPFTCYGIDTRDAIRVIGVNAVCLGARAASSYVTDKLASGISQYWQARQKKKLEAAISMLEDAITKNCGNELDMWGFPKGCEKEVKALFMMPKGIEELIKIKNNFHSKFKKNNE